VQSLRVGVLGLSADDVVLSRPLGREADQRVDDREVGRAGHGSSSHKALQHGRATPRPRLEAVLMNPVTALVTGRATPDEALERVEGVARLLLAGATAS
jgi:hypothetical protein